MSSDKYKIEVMKKLSKYIDIGIMAGLLTQNKCFKCGYKTKIIWTTGGMFYINPDFLVHYQQTHGVPLEITILQLADRIFVDLEAKDKWVKASFDLVRSKDVIC